MKSIVSVVSAASIVATSCGCAGIPFTNQRDPAIDAARMAQIERVSAGRGVAIYWVNPPLQKATPALPAAAPTKT